MIRYTAGEPVERYTTLLDPERKLPAYISKLTGIHDADLRESSRFAERADEIVTFLGDALLVGHNIMFDIGFVNAELRRAGKMPIVNDRIDTMALAMRYLPDLKRASLDKVASALGLSPRKLHRAEGDAELSARAALVLFRLAAERGEASVEALKATSQLPEARPRDGIGRGRALLDTDFLKTIPSKPGVYLMLDANRRVIYVGKAKDLRDRVGSYYSQPLGYTRKMDGLLESIASIDVRITGSELDALMLEAQLIKRYQPRYNTVMRSHERILYQGRSGVSGAYSLAPERKDVLHVLRSLPQSERGQASVTAEHPFPASHQPRIFKRRSLVLLPQIGARPVSRAVHRQGGPRGLYGADPRRAALSRRR